MAAWPGTEQLADDIHRAALAVPGVEEVDLEFVVMSDDERFGLRQRLRADMLGVADGGRRPTTTPGTGTDTHRRRRCPPSWPRRQDAGHRRLVGQGWRRQVDGHRQPRHCAGAGRLRRGAARRRRLRLLGPEDARDRPRPGRARRHRHPHVRPRGPVPVHGLFRPRRPARHLARAHAAQGHPAVPHRRLLGRTRLRPRRHAPRNGRRGADAGRGHAPGRDRRRHDAAGGGGTGGAALGLRGAPAQALRARRHREHELVHRRRRHPLRAVRRRRWR